MNQIIEKILNIIPKELEHEKKKSPKDFIRNRSISFSVLITFVLSLVASGKGTGVDTKSGIFFKNARRNGLLPEAAAVHRSSISKARKKVPWQIFENLANEAASLAYDVLPQDPKYLWHGMSVYAFDGSKYDLPATEQIREEFDSKSGLNHSGKGHYPQCLVSTAYDVFRRLPVGRTISSIDDGNEREDAKKLISRHIPPGNLLCFDRGYPSYEFILWLQNNYDGHFLFRCPGSNTFPAVENFLKSGESQAIISIGPSKKHCQSIPADQRATLKPLKIRAVKMVSPDGTVSILLTSLIGINKISQDELIDLYFRRWEVESYYRDEKVFLEIEKFHSRTSNGIRQELFAIMAMALISRMLMFIADETTDGKKYNNDPQFKNSIITIATDIAVFISKDPMRVIKIFEEMLAEIRRVRYYRSKKPRPSQPRVCKRPLNKWAEAKIKNLTT